MRSSLLAAFAAMAMAAGCVGTLESTPPGSGPGPGSNPGSPDGGTTGGGTANAKPLFDSDVYPIVSSKCAACHSAAGPAGNTTGFVATSAADGYSTITSYTSVVGNFAASAAPILGRIAEAGGHHGVAVYTSDEQAKITGWLNQEATLRAGVGTGGGGGSGSGSGSGSGPANETPSAATERLLGQLSACMTLTDFQTAKMGNGWGNMQANNGETCRSCHVGGAYGFMANPDEPSFFNTVDTNKYYMLQFFSVDLSGGTAAAKIIINQTVFQTVASGQAPFQQHPRFDPANNQGMTALKTLYTATMANMATFGQAGSKCTATSNLTN